MSELIIGWLDLLKEYYKHAGKFQKNIDNNYNFNLAVQ